MILPLQPIYLFADSQLLFWRDKGTLFLQSIREAIERATPKAAYIGASNGDDPQFYSIFEAAMEGIGIQDCKMILSAFPSDDEAFVKESGLILLAGGDVEKGWNVFTKVGLKELIVKRYYEGALLIGVSAGAVQLGLYGVIQDGSAIRLIETFKLVPFVIGAHEEKEKWKTLAEAVRGLDGSAQGIGLPSGGGLIYHPDHRIEAIRCPVNEFTIRDGRMSESLLMPSAAQGQNRKPAV